MPTFSFVTPVNARSISYAFSVNYDQWLEKRSIRSETLYECDTLPGSRNQDANPGLIMGTWDVVYVSLAVGPFLMAPFVHVGDEMGRNAFNRFGKAGKVSGSLFGCNLQTIGSVGRVDKGTSDGFSGLGRGD
jgi:hypothetical protein